MLSGVELIVIIYIKHRGCQGGINFQAARDESSPFFSEIYTVRGG